MTDETAKGERQWPHRWVPIEASPLSAMRWFVHDRQGHKINALGGCFDTFSMAQRHADHLNSLEAEDVDTKTESFDEGIVTSFLNDRKAYLSGRAKCAVIEEALGLSSRKLALLGELIDLEERAGIVFVQAEEFLCRRD